MDSPSPDDEESMTVTTDLATAHGKRRRLFLKIDGYEPILWQAVSEGGVPAWTLDL